MNVPHTREVKATNDAVGGFTSADVLRQLGADADVVSDVANADVVEKGPDYDSDETRYLASDGDHPNVAGHQLIAAAVVDVISKNLGMG